MVYLIYLFIGAVGGVLIALVGSGIGPIAVPSLILILSSMGVDYDLAVHVAVATSLAVVLMTTAISIGKFQHAQLIHILLLKKLLPGSVLGAVAGSVSSTLLNGKLLQNMFGVLLIFVSLLTLRKNESAKNYKEIKLPTDFSLLITTFLLSVCSTLLGISDGLLLVPYLCRYRLDIHTTIATATACAFCASLVGIIPYLLISTSTGLPKYCIGFIYLPAFISIALASCLFVPLGVHLNKISSEKKLKKIFSYFLIIIGFKMVIA